MFRDILLSRAILIGIVFFLGVVGSSLLYSWHVRRTLTAELAGITLATQHLEREKARHIAQDAGIPTETEVLETSQAHLSNDDTQTFSGEAKALLHDEASDSLDIAEAFFPKETREEAPTEDVRVSPFGFGPYPELPPGYPNPNLWDYADALYELSPKRAHDWELRERVCIKLWKQGKRSEGVAMENGLVYPCYENTVYIRWDEYIDDDGTPVAYITELLGSPSVARYLDDFDNNIIPPGVTVIPYDEGGIDPYTFLNLN